MEPVRIELTQPLCKRGSPPWYMRPLILIQPLARSLRSKRGWGAALPLVLAHSGRAELTGWDLNPRHPPCRGGALPLSYLS